MKIKLYNVLNWVLPLNKAKQNYRRFSMIGKLLRKNLIHFHQFLLTMVIMLTNLSSFGSLVSLFSRAPIIKVKATWDRLMVSFLLSLSKLLRMLLWQRKWKNLDIDVMIVRSCSLLKLDGECTLSGCLHVVELAHVMSFHLPGILIHSEDYLQNTSKER